MYSLNCKGRLLSWKDPIVMGVLNITPDSFFAGSRIRSEEMLISQAEKMLEEGAAILDLGGLSSRPGALEISSDAELERVVPAISLLSSRYPSAFISVDSYRYKVAEAALYAGASIINDIGAGENEELPKLAAAFQTPYVCMHIRGNPRNMQQLTSYDDISAELLDYFIKRKGECIRLGAKDIIIDPGFGFAKTIEQNFLLLKQMNLLGMLGLPIMVGLSRKATVYKSLNIKPEESLNGTTVMHTLALEQGAQILRVHDVKEAVETIRLWTSYANA
ncbi:MAG TPA: dihydropteroate synthase [Puia sp.]|jgi:dihydropteroate synthase|nr:dihydropteroate synthase [Puia sp.]